MPPSETQFPLEVIAETEMPPATDGAIKLLLCECFPADVEVYRHTRAWHDSAPDFSVVYREGDLVLGHVGIMIRAIRCGDASVTVAGIENFCVARCRRGTGLSGKLMARALDEAVQRGVVFGLLFCVPELERFYRSRGWSTTTRPVTMLDEDGRCVPIPAKNISMVIDLADEEFPPGAIDLQGRDW